MLNPEAFLTLLQKEVTDAKKLRVLCLDGGGQRGIIMAHTLEKLESATHKKVTPAIDDPSHHCSRSWTSLTSSVARGMVEYWPWL